MSPQDNIILLSTKIHPSEEELQSLDAQVALVHDWEAVARNLTERGVGPLFYSKLSMLSNRVLIPEVSYERLKQAYYRTLTRGMMLYDVFRRVADAFTLNGIRVVALKGIHLAEWLYQDIALRQFSDIDLLVTKEDGGRCLQILRDMGFVQSGDEILHMIDEKSGLIHYPPMVMNDVSVEIHIDLNRRQNLDIKKIIQCSERLTLNHTRVHVLELYDLLIFLCIHLDKHFRAGKVQFTCFCDIVNLIDIQAGEIDWQKLEIRCMLSRCEEMVYKYIYIAHKYFHARMPDAVAEQYAAYLLVQDEELFLRYLDGFRGTVSGVPNHLNNIARINGFREKLRYFLLVVFPSREFMVRSYSIKNPSLFRLYYLTRHLRALRGLWRMTFRNKNFIESETRTFGTKTDRAKTG